jgi:hypothetical protein
MITTVSISNTSCPIGSASVLSSRICISEEFDQNDFCNMLNTDILSSHWLEKCCTLFSSTIILHTGSFAITPIIKIARNTISYIYKSKSENLNVGYLILSVLSFLSFWKNMYWIHLALLQNKIYLIDFYRT